MGAMEHRRRPNYDPCEACDGTGFCSVCSGNGRYVPWGLDELVECEACAGSGECPECDGTGRVERNEGGRGPLDR